MTPIYKICTAAEWREAEREGRYRGSAADHKDGFIQLTTPGCHDILVFEEKKDQPIGQTGGIAHFGFRLRNAADIDEMVNKVIGAGGTIVDKGEFVPGSPYMFFQDPDGYNIEVWYELLK